MSRTSEVALRCVIFDLDNTLVDSDLDFAKIKAEIGTDQPILEYRARAGEAEQARVDSILDRHESRAAATCGIRKGAPELLQFLHSRGLRTALVTRNSRKATQTVISRHGLKFDMIVCREDSAPKPSPQPILDICRKFGIAPAETVVVGDYLYDILAGQAAGSRTILIEGPNRKSFVAHPDYETTSLAQVMEIIRNMLD